MWKGLYGCDADPNADGWSDATTTCTSMCGSRKGLLELCEMKGVGHQLDVPYKGYPFSAAW